MFGPRLLRSLSRFIRARLPKKSKEPKVIEEGAAQAPPTASKIYLKAMTLQTLDDVEKIKGEIRSGNIVIVRIMPLVEKSVEDAKRAISELSDFVGSVGGDIARLGEERIVLTPSNVQIWKEKSS